MIPDNYLDLPILVIQIANSFIILFIGIILTKITKLFIKKVIKGKLSLKNKDTVATFLASIVKYSIYAFVVFQILNVFGTSKEFMLGVASVGSIALGLGAKGIAEDFFVGISILFENQLQVGDNVSIEGKSGVVESIGLRIISIRSYDGDVHIFPNSSIRMITNMSKSFNRAVVDVFVSYSEDIEKVLMILRDEMEISKDFVNNMLTNPTVLGIVESTPYYMKIRIVADCKVSENWGIERSLRLRIKKRFEIEGIIFPIYATDLNMANSARF